MLEKFIKKLNFDAHFHYTDCKNLGICDFPDDFTGISCAHCKNEWEIQKNSPYFIIKSYGLHPQNARNYNLSSIYFLENLVSNKEISFIGECGFDLFCDEYKIYEKKQEEFFNIQIEMAIKNNLPVVIHCRKANHKLFKYKKQLSKLPEVLFHSFMGPSAEAFNLLNSNINGYFSFGKQIFNGNKKVLDCIKKLPAERILCETDAPFQFLKGEKFTSPAEITKIQQKVSEILETRSSFAQEGKTDGKTGKISLF